MTFGEFFTEKRIQLGQPLREFCRLNGFDASNLSKIERDLINPPHDRSKLETYATALGIKKDSDDWIEFFDLAAIYSGRIPEYIMSDTQIVSALPMLFRTIKGKEITEEDLNKIIKEVREG